MSGPCTDCGGPDYQTLMARIVEMEAATAKREEWFAFAIAQWKAEKEDWRRDREQAEDALAEFLAATDNLRAFLKSGDLVTVRTPGEHGSVTFAMDKLACRPPLPRREEHVVTAAEWWERANMLCRVADFTRTGKKVLVVAATQRHAKNMRRELRAAGVDMALLKFTTPASLHSAEGLRVDHVEIDAYARIVARRYFRAEELEYMTRMVTL